MSKDSGIRQRAPNLQALFSGQHGRVVRLDGNDWWLDGLAQLQGKIRLSGATNYQRFDDYKFLWERKGAIVGRTFREASWLQGTIWPAPVGDIPGWLDWHYADGSVQRVSMIYGGTTARFWGATKQIEKEQGYPEPVWKIHETVESVGNDRWVRLYRQTWKNPRPDVAVTSLDFVSNPDCPAAPFIIAANVFQ